ncbi:6363_t:CDS:2 [Scutellospora calospora]|uniref:6363_t:CDS:1 n=1 Tax=Scutellospora calospora TaxID=85575 RepID=A0ACA9K611_9GLOM|nr:6363_t:CDS:2 [Scutellospora calospora]
MSIQDEKRKPSSLGLKNYIAERQIELPLKIISAILASYLVSPDPQNPFSKFLFISYHIYKTDSDGNISVLYGKGYWDFAYITFWVVVFTLIRECIMWYILRPIAIWGGIKSERKIVRFMEQGYVTIYYIIAASVGLVIMRNSPYWFFETKHLWVGYPHYELTYLAKSYYLIQFAFWLQQIVVLVLQIERPRKDLLQLIAHHIITILLIGGSYLSNFTRTGNAVFITMDFSDIWLGLSKCMKYLNLPGFVTNISFINFMIIWVYARHYLYGIVAYSLWADSCLPENNECIWDPLNGYWLTWWSKYIILFGMLLLQILMIYWFILILRIAWKVANGQTAEDSRSDSENDEDCSEKAPLSKKTD